MSTENKSSFWLLFHNMPCRVIASTGWMEYFKKYYSNSLVTFPSKRPDGIYSTLVLHDVGGKSYHTLYKARFRNLSCDVHVRRLDHSIYPLITNTLQRLFTRLVYHYSGFVIHSSSVLYKGKAYLFIGHSGAGKTTAANISHRKGLEILSDNYSFVLNNKKNFLLYPFPHSQYHAKGIHKPVPLKACFILKKSNKVRIVEVPESHKLKLFREEAQIQLPADQKGTYSAVLFTFINFVKMYKLEFTQVDDFWNKLPG